MFKTIIPLVLLSVVAIGKHIIMNIPIEEKEQFTFEFFVPQDATVTKEGEACAVTECMVEQIRTVAIYSDVISNDTHAIQITGDDALTHYIPLQTDGSEAEARSISTIKLKNNKVAETAYRVPFAVTKMSLVKKDAAGAGPGATIYRKIGPGVCTVKTGAPCFQNGEPYNVTIKGTMKDANREYKVEPKTADGFTALIFLFTPLKSSAATVVAFTGLAFAAVLQVAF